MSTIINLKTDPEIKAQAQKVAEELGFSLSALINAYLRHLIKTRTVYFSLGKEEESVEELKVESKVEKKVEDHEEF